MTAWNVLDAVSQYKTKHLEYSGGDVIEDIADDDVHPFSVHHPPGSTIGDAVMAELRQTYITTLHTIRNLCPHYCSGTNWAWMGDRPKFASFRAVIMSIFVVLFGDYARVAIGYVNDSDMWTPVPIFLPRYLSGLDPVSRSGDFFCHQSIHNYAVYKSMCHYNIHDIVNDFVRTLRRCGFFDATSNIYLVSSNYDPFVAPAVIEALCQVPNNADGGLGQSHGIQTVDVHSPNDYAFGGVVVRCPLSPPTDAWKFMKRDDIPQIRVEDVDYSVKPFISDTRFAAMENEDDELRLLTMIGDCNKILVMFAESIYVQSDKSLEWVNRIIVAIMHKYCPNYMALIGAQYLQNICVANADSIPDTDPRPRAYFPDEQRYESKITSDQAALCAQMAYCVASTLFSNVTKTVICVGTPGSGKSTISKIVTAMAGGHKFVYILTSKSSTNASFSLANYEGTYVIITDDTVNGAGPDFISSAIFEGLGSKRGTRSHITIEKKHKDRYTVLELGKSVLLQGNFPKAPTRDLDDISTYIKYAATQSSSDAIIRRSMVAPPHLEMLSLGTANQVSANGWSFDNDVLHDIKAPNTEVPFIIIASVMIAILGNAVEDRNYGLLGKYPTPSMLQCFYKWKEFGEDPEGVVRSTLDILLEASRPIEFKLDGDKVLVMRQGIHQSEIISGYKKVARMALTVVPQKFGHPTTVLACRYCYIVFSGVNIDINSTQDIANAYSKCVNINRSTIKQKCPCAPEPLDESEEPLRCMDCVEQISVHENYKLRNMAH